MNEFDDSLLDDPETVSLDDIDPATGEIRKKKSADSDDWEEEVEE